MHRVTIPPGCQDGQVLKLAVDEDILKSCTKEQERHFYAYVSVTKDPEMTREGFHIHSQVKNNFFH